MTYDALEVSFNVGQWLALSGNLPEEGPLSLSCKCWDVAPNPAHTQQQQPLAAVGRSDSPPSMWGPSEPEFRSIKNRQSKRFVLSYARNRQVPPICLNVLYNFFGFASGKELKKAGDLDL